MDILDVTGIWWLPDHPDRQIHGRLTFDPKKGGQLALDGILRRLEDLATPELLPSGDKQIAVTGELLEAAGNYGRIHGRCENRAFTLDNCFQLNSKSYLFSGDGTELIHVGQIYDGIWFNPGEKAGGDKFDFEALNLASWVARTGISVSMGSENDRLVECSVQGAALSSERASIGSGETVSLDHGITISKTDASVFLRDSFRIKVEYGEFRTIQELSDGASDIQDLISMGTGGTAQFTNVRVWHPDLAAEEKGRGARKGYFTFYAPWSAVEPESVKLVKPHEFYFTAQDLGGINFFPNWMLMARRHRSALGRVMSTRYSTGMQMADRFINRAAALEGFDRVESGKAQNRIFAARIKSCIEVAGSPFKSIVQNPDKWVQEFKHHRNELAHHYGRRMLHSGVEQHWLSESAYWLFVFCLLRKAGANDAALGKIVQNPKIQYLGKMVRRHI